MWRLMHRLFGWHYVHMENTAVSIVRRVRWTKEGRPYAAYSEPCAFYEFLDEKRGWKVTALTFTKPKEWP